MLTSNALQQLAARELLRRRRGRASLTGFASAIEIPGKPVEDDPDAWLFKPVETALASHHLLLLQALERTAARRHGRLMVFMPPGSAKSTYSSVVAPTYFMGREPDRRIILASYGQDLARRHGRRARQVVKSAGFASLFGCTISASTSAADEWALTNGSEYLACGILSGITGNRAHGIIIDDPVKGREQADSPTIRAKTWDAYSDDLLTRLIPGGWVVLVQTRWHSDDLAGRLLPDHYNGESGLIECADGKTWEVINLPAQAERNDDPLGREPGVYLWPEWFDEGHWDTFKRQARTWAALFQQRPRPSEGGIFKAAWIRERYRAVPAAASTVIHSWDTAQKPGQLNDPSVCTAWSMGRGAPGYYLRDVYRQRVDYPTLKRQVINMAERDKPTAILIEDKSSGQSLIQDLRSSTSLPIIAIEPLGDKIFRANEVSALVEAGLVHLPESAPWLADFEAEFFGFPLVAHDDQCFIEGTLIATARGDVPIQDIKEGEMVLTPDGFRKVTACGATGIAPVIEWNGLTGTSGHLVFTYTKGWAKMDSITQSDVISELNLCSLVNAAILRTLSSTEESSEGWAEMATTTCLKARQTMEGSVLKACMLQFGSFILEGRFHQAMKFITLMATHSITALKTWNVYRAASTGKQSPSKTQRSKQGILQKFAQRLLNGTSRRLGESGTRSTPPNQLESQDLSELTSASSAERFLSQRTPNRNTAQTSVEASTDGRTKTSTLGERMVFNMTVDGANCYYANGILVHNCDSLTQFLKWAREWAGGPIQSVPTGRVRTMANDMAGAGFVSSGRADMNGF